MGQPPLVMGQPPLGMGQPPLGMGQPPPAKGQPLKAFQPPPTTGQKRDALGRPKKRMISTPMQLTAADNQLKRVYSFLFEAHALLDGLLQDTHKGPDPYWMLIDWDLMLEEVQQMHDKLVKAHGLAHELHRSHEEALTPGLC